MIVLWEMLEHQAPLLEGREAEVKAPGIVAELRARADSLRAEIEAKRAHRDATGKVPVGEAAYRKLFQGQGQGAQA